MSKPPRHVKPRNDVGGNDSGSSHEPGFETGHETGHKTGHDAGQTTTAAAVEAPVSRPPQILHPCIEVQLAVSRKRDEEMSLARRAE